MDEKIEDIAIEALEWADLPNTIALAKCGQADARTNRRWIDATAAARIALSSAQPVPKELLAPFIEVANSYSDREDDSFKPWIDAPPLTLGDFRKLRAYAALLPTTPQPVEGPSEPVADGLLVNSLMDALFGPFDPRSNSQTWVSPDRSEVRARLEKALSLAVPPLPAQGTVAWTMRTLFRAMQEACANYIEPTTYIARFPAESTLRATEFAEPHPLNSDVQKRVMKERRDTAFINDIIRMLDGPEQREAEAFASPPVDSDALKALPKWWNPSDKLEHAARNLQNIREDFDAEDGDRRGIASALGAAELHLVKAVILDAHSRLDGDDQPSSPLIGPLAKLVLAALSSQGIR